MWQVVAAAGGAVCALLPALAPATAAAKAAQQAATPVAAAAAAAAAAGASGASMSARVGMEATVLLDFIRGTAFRCVKALQAVVNFFVAVALTINRHRVSLMLQARREAAAATLQWLPPAAARLLFAMGRAMSPASPALRTMSSAELLPSVSLPISPDNLPKQDSTEQAVAGASHLDAAAGGSPALPGARMTNPADLHGAHGMQSAAYMYSGTVPAAAAGTHRWPGSQQASIDHLDEAWLLASYYRVPRFDNHSPSQHHLYRNTWDGQPGEHGVMDSIDSGLSMAEHASAAYRQATSSPEGRWPEAGKAQPGKGQAHGGAGSGTGGTLSNPLQPADRQEGRGAGQTGRKSKALTSSGRAAPNRSGSGEIKAAGSNDVPSSQTAQPRSTSAPLRMRRGGLKGSTLATDAGGGKAVSSAHVKHA